MKKTKQKKAEGVSCAAVNIWSDATQSSAFSSLIWVPLGTELDCRVTEPDASSNTRRASTKMQSPVEREGNPTLVGYKKSLYSPFNDLKYSKYFSAALAIPESC